MEFQILTVSEDRYEKTCGGGDGYRDINKVSFDDLIAINDGVDDGVLL